MWRFRNIKGRLIAIFIVVCILSLFVFSFGYYLTMEKVEEMFKQELKGEGDSAVWLIRYVYSLYNKGKITTYNEFISTLKDLLYGKRDEITGVFTHAVVKMGKTGYIYVVSCENGQPHLVLHPFLEGKTASEIKSFEKENRNILKEVCRIKNGFLEYSWKNPQEKSYRKKVAYCREIPELGWIVGISFYMDDYLGVLKDIALNTFGLLLFVIVLLGIMGILLYKGLILRIERLVKAISEVDFSEGVDQITDPIVKDKDEIGYLARKFNDLLIELKSQYEEIEAYSSETVAMNEQLMAQQEELLKLYDELSRKTDVLVSLTKAISDISVETDEVKAAKEILSYLVKRFKAYGGVIAFLKGSKLLPLVYVGYEKSKNDPLFMSKIKRSVDITKEGKYLAIKAILTKRVAIAKDTKKAEYYYPLDENVLSEICAPLIHLGEVVGVICLSFDRKWDKVNIDIQLFEILSSFLASVIVTRRFTSEIKESYYYLAEKIFDLSKIKDIETSLHMKRTALYANVVALELGLSSGFIQDLKSYVPLHDIGKLKISQDILRKKGKLTPEEFEEIKKHTIYGAEILGEKMWLRCARNICLYHHENWDGSGYPKGLRATEIPLEARITKLVDVYDALRESRPYKRGFSHQEAFEIITKGDGRVMPSHFDPDILNVFLKRHKEFSDIFLSNQGY